MLLARSTFSALLLATFLTLPVLAAFSVAGSPALMPFHGLKLGDHKGTSTNWGGYAIETNLNNPQKNVVTDAQGNWVVPAVTCSGSNTYSAAWVGIDGYASNTVEQTGTESDCINGAPSYAAWYEMYPKASQPINMAIHAGDTMFAEVKFNGGSSFTLTLKDVTTGASFSTDQNSRKAARSSAEWIQEDFAGALANFGTIAFSNSKATVNGHAGTISDAAWQNDPITMVNRNGQVKASVSGLNGAGDAFTMTWQRSS